VIIRLTIATVSLLLLASLAFSQMKYSRPKSQSATPTPTPTPVPQQRNVTSSQPRAKNLPTPTPVPQYRPGTISPQFAPKPSPTPLPRTMQPTVQPRTATTQTVVRPTAAPAQPPTRSQSTAFMPSKATPAPIQPKFGATPAPIQPKPTPPPPPPPDVKAYVDRQIASSQDKKFHFPMKGKELALTPFFFWPQKTTAPGVTSTYIDMKTDNGSIYTIEFLTNGAQVSGIRIHRVNGEGVR
jgi:hypothetical protein